MEEELCNIPVQMQKCRSINWGRAGKEPGERSSAGTQDWRLRQNRDQLQLSTDSQC